MKEMQGLRSLEFAKTRAKDQFQLVWCLISHACWKTVPISFFRWLNNLWFTLTTQIHSLKFYHSVYIELAVSPLQEIFRETKKQLLQINISLWQFFMQKYCSHCTSEGMNGIILIMKLKIKYTKYIGFRHLNTWAVENLRFFFNFGVITAL